MKKKDVKDRVTKRLSYIDFEKVKGWANYWSNKPNYLELRQCKNFEESRSEFTKWTIEFLKRFYKVKCYMLDTTPEYNSFVYNELEKYLEENEKELKKEPSYNRNTFIEKSLNNLNDVIAFNIGDDKPILYLLIINQPCILDESMFDPYDIGQDEKGNDLPVMYLKPNWSEINYC